MSDPRNDAHSLTRIGAESAESAFSLLLDRTIEMGEIVLRAATSPMVPTASEWDCGVIFELEGELDAWVGLLFRTSQRDALVERMLGAEAKSMGEMATESALMEVANIVASHVASGLADALGDRLLPSVPMLAPTDAAAQLEILLRERARDFDRGECELLDEQSELGGLLVLATRSGP